MPLRSIATACLLAAPLALSPALAAADALTGVPNANPKAVGVTVPTVLSPELAQVVRAQGSTPVENPSAFVKYYGYLNDQPNLLPALGSNVEATKTEPDKNTYLVLRRPEGRRPRLRLRDSTSCSRATSWGRPVSSPGSTSTQTPPIASPCSPTSEDDATPLPVFDGSTWYPWAERLLFSQEGNGSTTGGIWQATPDYPPSGAEPVGRDRPWRIRGHAGGLRRQPLDRGGHRRGRSHRADEREAAQQLRLPFHPEVPERPHAGREAAGAAGEVPPKRPAHHVPDDERLDATTSRTCTPTAWCSTRAG